MSINEQDTGKEFDDELLEYESDDDQFESLYIESQIGAHNGQEIQNKQLEVVDNLEEEEEGEEADSDGNDYEEEELVAHDDDFENSNEEEVQFEKQFEQDFREEIENADVYDDGFVEINEEVEDVAEDESPGNLGTAENTEVVDDFSEDDDDDDEEAEERHESITDEGLIDFEQLKRIPVYLDFCDFNVPSSSTASDISNLSLSEFVGKPSFDFLKLFVPECVEDELYSEFDPLFQNFEQCHSLKIDELFNKISDLIEVDLTKVKIHIKITDLLNLTLDSESSANSTLSLVTILEAYNNLRKRSPNADLHRFISVRVWCSRSTQDQIRILSEASLNGYRLENLGECLTGKVAGKRRSEEEEEQNYGDSIKKQKTNEVV